jgi:antitoxin ParD1/3/4
MSVLNLSLPDSLAEFVAEQVTAQGYASATDYVLDLVRKAQRVVAERELERLVLPALESLDRGEGKEMTADDWERLRQRLRDKRNTPANP